MNSISPFYQIICYPVMRSMAFGTPRYCLIKLLIYNPSVNSVGSVVV